MRNGFFPIGLALCGALAFTVACNKQKEVQAVSQDHVPPVAVAKASTRDLSRSVVLTADFKPFQEVDVMAKVSGYVKTISVDVGDRVKQGRGQRAKAATLRRPSCQFLLRTGIATRG